MEDYSLKNNQKSTSYYDLADLKTLVKNLNEADALTLHSLLSARLNLGAANIDLLEELDHQFRNAKMLQAEAMESDSESGMKDRTATLNQVTNMLKMLAETRDAVLSQERLKRYEAAIRLTLAKAPTEMREAYIDLYGEYLTSQNIEELRNGPPGQ